MRLPERGNIIFREEREPPSNIIFAYPGRGKPLFDETARSRFGTFHPQNQTKSQTPPPLPLAQKTRPPCLGARRRLGQPGRDAAADRSWKYGGIASEQDADSKSVIVNPASVTASASSTHALYISGSGTAAERYPWQRR